MLVLLRHGQTDANARGVLLGRSDVPLTALGRRQAVAAGRALPRDARIVTSPLERARETAALAVPGAQVTVDDRWIEIDYGEYEQMTMSGVSEVDRLAWRSEVSFRPPGGESLVDVGRRVRAAIESLMAEAQERDVVVVSHVSPIKAAIAWALGVGDEVAWRLHLSVAAISRIAVGSMVVLESFNETAHLEAMDRH